MLKNSLFLHFFFELICDEVLVIPFFLPVAVTVGSTFPDVVVGNRKEVKSELDVLLVFFRIISQEVTARAVDDADVPSMTNILCTVLWVQHRVVHTIRCFQLL